LFIRDYTNHLYPLIIAACTGPALLEVPSIIVPLAANLLGIIDHFHGHTILVEFPESLYLLASIKASDFLGNLFSFTKGVPPIVPIYFLRIAFSYI
jgi:hypothetical protein